MRRRVISYEYGWLEGGGWEKAKGLPAQGEGHRHKHSDRVCGGQLHPWHLLHIRAQPWNRVQICMAAHCLVCSDSWGVLVFQGWSLYAHVKE